MTRITETENGKWLLDGERVFDSFGDAEAAAFNAEAANAAEVERRRQWRLDNPEAAASMDKEAALAAERRRIRPLYHDYCEWPSGSATADGWEVEILGTDYDVPAAITSIPEAEAAIAILKKWVDFRKANGLD